MTGNETIAAAQSHAQAGGCDNPECTCENCTCGADCSCGGGSKAQ